MKKFLTAITVIIMCLCLCSCGGKDDGRAALVSDFQTESRQSAESVPRKTTKASDKGEKSSSESKSSSSKKVGHTEKSTVTASVKTTPAEITSAKNKKPADTTEKKTEVSCTVTVECKEILGNMEMLKEGHEKYVPSNGVILSETRITVKSGETVYQAVKKACDKNKIRLDSVKSGYGTYVTGFDFIDEKDCGKTSGWIYFVNGSSPSVSSSKLKVKEGDRIVFSYTLNK